VQTAVTLEEVARLALLTRQIAPHGPRLEDWVRDKHHERKHGPAASYGQG
jgi:L-ribulose-5-phosphate 4-epimerase